MGSKILEVAQEGLVQIRRDRDKSQYPVVTPSMIPFEMATSVISAAQKFVVPILSFPGAPLVFPTGHEKAGQPITDWQGNPIGDSGVVFRNAKDNCWQAAPSDGTGVVIMNQVTREQAQQLHAAYQSMVAGEAPALGPLQRFLRYASDVVGIGDMYNSDVGFIAKNMTPVEPGNFIIDALGRTFGFLKRDARDISMAIYLLGGFQFQGPAATAQLFENGGVIVRAPNQDAPYGVQPDAFRETYRLADGGTEITDPEAQMHSVRVEELLRLKR